MSGDEGVTMGESESLSLDDGYDGWSAGDLLSSGFDVPENPYPRKRLLTKMLANRGVVRQLCAPNGFGKSTLAYEYATCAFSPGQTLWVDCQDPEFICALDRDIFPACYLSDEFGHADDSALIVFDDLCLLDEERAERFSKGIDRLLSEGKEVVISSIPACDCLGQLQMDRICLTARDLLVETEELSAAGCSHEVMATAENLGIPSLVWVDHEAGLVACVRGMFDEGLPTDVTLPAFAMLLLGRGTLVDLVDLGIPVPPDVRNLLAASYPQVGLGTAGDRFCAVPIPMSDLIACSHGLLDDRGYDELVSNIAQLLMVRRDVERAIEFIRRARGEDALLDWTGRHGLELVDRGFSAAVRNVFIANRTHVLAKRPDLLGLYAWAEFLTGDVVGAGDLSMADAGASFPSSEGARRVLAYLIMHAYQLDVRKEWMPGVSGAFERLDLSVGCALQCLSGDDLADCPFSRPDDKAAPCARSTLLARTVLSMIANEDCEALAGYLAQVVHGESGLISVNNPIYRICLHIAYLVALRRIGVRQGSRAGDTDEDGEGVKAAVKGFPDGLALLMARSLSACQLEDACRLSAIIVRDDLLKLVEMGAIRPATGDMTMRGHLEIPPMLQEQADRLAMLFSPPVDALPSDKAFFSEEVRETDDDKVEAARLELPIGSKVMVGDVRVPMLYLRFFGGFEAYLDGEPAPQEMWGTRRVRTIFCLLATVKGNEVLNKKLSETIWPGLDSEHLRNNLYSLFSYMKRQMGFSEFPYIIRSRDTCRLNRECLRTDIADFDEVCRVTVSHRDDLAERIRRYARIDELYQGDLFPTELDIPDLDQVRNWYRSIYVDTMIDASIRSADVGNVLASLWFARKAYERGAGREDVYRTMMQAQLAAGQRSAVIETYEECRRYLREELGVVPSDATVDLYNRALLPRYRASR